MEKLIGVLNWVDGDNTLHSIVQETNNLELYQIQRKIEESGVKQIGRNDYFFNEESRTATPVGGLSNRFTIEEAIRTYWGVISG